MNHLLDPTQNKSLFKQYLLKLKERDELDDLMIEYISIVLEHRIYHWPSVGRYGEQGKDIVAIENKETNEYCSYIIKSGNLNENLTGDFGILTQLIDAMTIPIEDFKDSKRTATVVYNGTDGYRGSVETFNNKKKEVQDNAGELLLRDIERWDVEVIVEKIFPVAERLREMEEIRMDLERKNQKEQILDNFISEVRIASGSGANVTSLVNKLINDHNEIENNLGIRGE